MAHTPFEGTPKPYRTRAAGPRPYRPVPPPERPVRFILAWLGAAAVLFATVIALYAVGSSLAPYAPARRALSPGPLASQHAGFEIKCAQCHDTGKAVTPVRCERCHDATNSQRLTHFAHILIGTGDPNALARAEERPCQSCHVEHKGREAVLRAVDNRECGSCHRTDSGQRLTTFAGHPEFAAVKAGATAGLGILFSHQKHLEETEKRRAGETCSVCHEATADRRGFQPIAFDRHCASCHLTNGFLPYRAENVATTYPGETPGQGTVLALPGELPPDVLGNSKAQLMIDPDVGEATITQLRHRDPWVLYNALRLRSGIDPNGYDAERLNLQAQFDYLDSLLRARAVPAMAANQLESAIVGVQREIAEIDERLRQATDTARALDPLTENVRTIARQLQGVDSVAEFDLKNVVDAAGPRSSQPAPGGGAAEAADFERRKAEVVALLKTISARTAGDARLRDRAAALQRQVDALKPDGGNGGDPEPLLARLGQLESILQSLGPIQDTGTRAELADVDLDRRFGIQRITAGVAPEDFEGRRRELLSLLDSIERRAPAPARLRLASLRQRVLALRSGSIGDVELQRQRRERQRQLDRLRVELELQRSPIDREPPRAAEAQFDAAEITSARDRLRGTLARFEAVPTLELPGDPDTFETRGGAFTSLLTGVCTKCHDLDKVRARIVPVRIAEPVMPRSVFNHAPHVTRTACETCHGGRPQRQAAGQPAAPSIWTSTEASNVNVPGKAVCATCHAPSRTRDDCETCHVYHATSPARLVTLHP